MLFVTQQFTENSANINPHGPGTRLIQYRNECRCMQVQHPPATTTVAVDFHHLLRQAELHGKRLDRLSYNIGI